MKKHQQHTTNGLTYQKVTCFLFYLIHVDFSSERPILRVNSDGSSFAEYLVLRNCGGKVGCATVIRIHTSLNERKKEEEEEEKERQVR